KGYRLMDVTTRKIVYSPDVDFDETVFPTIDLQQVPTTLTRPTSSPGIPQDIPLTRETDAPVVHYTFIRQENTSSESTSEN
ncbi:TPA: LOW QUALITY PROTEIN: hypothetical protein N0F65_005092, partial [Lagenidium giganteum]